MGTLIHGRHSGHAPVVLRARHLVGRAARCDLQLTEPSVSGEHALLLFDDGAWWVRDLGSRNGTRVEEEPLEPGQAHKLAEGSRVNFAGSGPWILGDGDPPRAAAMLVGGNTVVELSAGMIALPSEEDPEVLVTQVPDGSWTAQRADGDEPVSDGQIITVGTARYRLSLPTLLSATLTVAERMPTVDDCRLRFRVSQNEEAVEVDIIGSGKTLSLPERAHHYPLLHLSRLRRQDLANDVPAHEAGWIDRHQLAADLRTSSTSLNVQLYRARKQYAEAGLGGAEELIARRGREIRLNVDETEEGPLG